MARPRMVPACRLEPGDVILDGTARVVVERVERVERRGPGLVVHGRDKLTREPAEVRYAWASGPASLAP